MFDQPLYIKALDVLAFLPEIPDTMLVVTLASFHMLMSFLGATEYGMQHILWQAMAYLKFSAHPVPKILSNVSGHADKIPIPVRMLLQLALSHYVRFEEREANVKQNSKN